MTRPRAAAERFVARLAQEALREVDVIYAPLVEIVGKGAVPDLSGYAGVIFTSGHGVGFAPKGAGRPAYCVGEKTAAQAQTQGWDVRITAPQAEVLIDTLSAHPVQGPLAHLCGTHRRGEIAQRLTANGTAVTEYVLYDQPLRALTPTAMQALAGEVPAIVPLFSPRTAAQFAKEVKATRNVTTLVMSDAVAGALGDVAFCDMLRAKAPTGDEMARCVELWLLGTSLS